MAEHTWAAVERARAEAALRENEARLRSVFAIKTVGVLFWGENFGLTEVNEAFLRMTGFSREEALGKTWQELTPEEFHPPSLRAAEEVTTLGEITPYEKQHFRKDGSRWWGLFAARKVGDEVVEFVLDVTDRKRAEAAPRELNEALEARVSARTAELMAAEEALGQLTGGIARDFNNMLQGIGGSLELMRRRVEQGRADEAIRHVESARKTADPAHHGARDRGRAAPGRRHLDGALRSEPVGERPAQPRHQRAWRHARKRAAHHQHEGRAPLGDGRCQPGGSDPRRPRGDYGR